MFPDIVKGCRFQLFKIMETMTIFLTKIPIALIIRPVFCRYDRKFLIRIVKQASILIKKLIQILFLKPLYTGLQRQLCVFTDAVYRIKLNASRLSDIIQCAGFSLKDMGSVQPLLHQKEPSGLLFTYACLYHGSSPAYSRTGR